MVTANSQHQLLLEIVKKGYTRKNMNWKKTFKYVMIFGILPLMVGLTLYGLDEQGFFQVNDIKVSILVKPSQKNFVKPYAEILELKLLPFKGISLLKFPMQTVSDLLKKQDWIQDFRITRSWPSSMMIELEPVEVSFLIQPEVEKMSKTTLSIAETTFYPVTSQGRALPAVDSKQTPNVAIARGDIFLKNKKIREGALEVLKSLPSGGNMHQTQVSEIGYDKKDGYWVGLIQENTKVKFGEDQFALKASRVSQVLDYLEQRDLKARVIDANLSKKVLVRLQQNP